MIINASAKSAQEDIDWFAFLHITHIEKCIFGSSIFKCSSLILKNYKYVTSMLRAIPISLYLSRPGQRYLIYDNNRVEL